MSAVVAMPMQDPFAERAAAAASAINETFDTITSKDSSSEDDDDRSNSQESASTEGDELALIAKLQDVRAVSLGENVTAYQFTGSVGSGARSIVMGQPLAKPTPVTKTMTYKVPQPAVPARKQRGFRRQANKKEAAPSTITKTIMEWQPFETAGSAVKGWVSYYEVSLSAAAHFERTIDAEQSEEVSSETEEAEGHEECVSVGISLAGFDKYRSMPGWQRFSYGYHGDDGAAFCDRQASRPYGPSFGAGDIVGCGIDWHTRRVFYTKNGEFLGYHSAIAESPEQGHKPREWYPTIGLDSHACVQINVGETSFAFDLNSMITKVNRNEEIPVASWQEDLKEEVESTVAAVEEKESEVAAQEESSLAAVEGKESDAFAQEDLKNEDSLEVELVENEVLKNVDTVEDALAEKEEESVVDEEEIQSNEVSSQLVTEEEETAELVVDEEETAVQEIIKEVVATTEIEEDYPPVSDAVNEQVLEEKKTAKDSLVEEVEEEAVELKPRALETSPDKISEEVAIDSTDVAPGQKTMDSTTKAIIASTAVVALASVAFVVGRKRP